MSQRDDIFTFEQASSYVIIAPSNSGKTNLIHHLLNQIRTKPNTKTYIFTNSNSNSTDSKNLFVNSVDSSTDICSYDEKKLYSLLNNYHIINSEPIFVFDDVTPGFAFKQLLGGYKSNNINVIFSCQTTKHAREAGALDRADYVFLRTHDADSISLVDCIIPLNFKHLFQIDRTRCLQIMTSPYTFLLIHNKLKNNYLPYVVNHKNPKYHQRR